MDPVELALVKNLSLAVVLSLTIAPACLTEKIQIQVADSFLSLLIHPQADNQMVAVQSVRALMLLSCRTEPETAAVGSAFVR
ncbi:hypothetical protein HDU91_001885, partial [Kappamyces sp. JEL0680]